MNFVHFPFSTGFPEADIFQLVTLQLVVMNAATVIMVCSVIRGKWRRPIVLIGQHSTAEQDKQLLIHILCRVVMDNSTEFSTSSLHYPTTDSQYSDSRVRAL